jgi:hypothetical protein
MMSKNIRDTKYQEWLEIYKGDARLVDDARVLKGYLVEGKSDEKCWLSIIWWDGKNYRATIGFTSKPNTYYRLDDKHNFVEVKESGE